MSGVYRRLGHMTCPTQAHLLMDIHLQEKGQNSAFYVENDIQKHTNAITFTVSKCCSGGKDIKGLCVFFLTILFCYLSVSFTGNVK